MSQDGNGKHEHRSTLELVESIRMHSLVIDLLEFRSPRRQLAAIQSVKDDPSLLSHPQVVDALRDVAAQAGPQVSGDAAEALKLLPPA